MKWIKLEDEKPPVGLPVLVVKQWLDAEYGPQGYNPDKSYWSTPRIEVDRYYPDFYWSGGGKVTHWMPLPTLPKQ